MGTIYIGISGWTFDGWRGTFYPEGLKQKDELAYASRQVLSIEVNGTFHSLFRPTAYKNWYEQTPPDFVFAIKGPKYITHERRLRDFETPLSNFLASGILALGEKLGPILWQFPPTLKFDAERFEPFMAALPHDMATAAKLGLGHSTWLEGRTHLDVPQNLPMRHAIEGRHDSFRDPVFVELARKYGIAIVVGDTAGRWPYIEDLTTDFVYLRMHGDETKYPNGYTKEALEHWARRYQSWSEGSQPADAAVVVPGTPSKIPRPVFAFFDNDIKETAALSAMSIISHLTQLSLLPPRNLELPAIAAPKAAKTAKTELKTTKPKAEKAPKTEAEKNPRKAFAEKVKKAKKTARAKPAAKKKSTPKRTARSA